MKILILKPSSLGDVVQALPVLRLLKRRYPESAIYWWIDARLAPLLEGDRDLAGVLSFHRHRWTEPIIWGAMWRKLRWVRETRFDVVLDLQCLARTALFAWLAKGELTIGLDEPREGARGIYDYAVRRRSFTTHAVDWYLSVLPLLDTPFHAGFDWIPARPAVAERIRASWPAEARRWVLFQPGARWLNKRWPLAYFQTLLRDLAQNHPDLQFAVTGGAEDRALGARLAEALDPGRVRDLTGKVSLPEMVEWVRLSTLLISNDTGPMHVAAAVGTPVVALFGPTEPRRTGPYGQLDRCLRADLPCVPCMTEKCHNPRRQECLEVLAPELALAAAERVLSEPPRSPGARMVPRPSLPAFAAA